MKKLSLLFLTMVLALVLSACGQKSDDYYISYGLHYDTMNYLVSSSASDSDIYANFIDGLVENDKYGAIQPSLAESWTDEVVAGNKHVWTFTIRKDATWVDVDGEEVADVVADDWVAAAEYILTPQTNSETSWLMMMFIDGAEAYYDAKVKTMNAQAKLKTAQDSGVAADITAAQAALDAAKAAELPFSTVGVKATGEKTLEYTLAKPAPYFVTALTYSVFFPVNREYLTEAGTDFGKDGDNILYNGGYLMADDVVNNKIVIEKNPAYWDAKHVYINRVVFIYIPDDAGTDWARLKYENGELTGIRLTEQDTQGWEKYITGKDGSGSRANPASPEVYIAESVSKYTYYMLWNFDRENFDKSDRTADQHDDTQEAIYNKNFRLGFFHGMDRSKFLSYYTKGNPLQWARNVYTPRGLAQDQNGKDYVDHLEDVYAAKQNISLAEAEAQLADGVDSKFKKDLAAQYFQTAKTELQAQGITDFPIVIETVISNSAAILPYYDSIVADFNSRYGEIAEWKLVIASTGDEWNLLANEKYSYDLRFMMGWGPDYGDPLTYLNTYVLNGDMQDYGGLNYAEAADKPILENLFGTYSTMVGDADKIWEEDRLDERFRKMAEAEYKLLYEEALIIPLLAQNGLDVYVSRSKPYQAMKAMYGLSGAKYKHLVVLNEPLTRQERDKLKAEYDAENPANK